MSHKHHNSTSYRKFVISFYGDISFKLDFDNKL